MPREQNVGSGDKVGIADMGLEEGGGSDEARLS